MKPCYACQMPLADDATACHRCGASVKGAKAPAPDPQVVIPTETTPGPEPDEEGEETDDEGDGELPVEAEETETDVPVTDKSRKPTKARKGATKKRGGR